MTEPVVTTVLPTFKRPGLLRRAIESVLGQTYGNFQLNVYDNASGDETEAVVTEYSAKDPRITYDRHPSNIGLAANLAFGLERVSTRYYSVLSDDDWLLPGFYETCVRALEGQPDAAFASTRVIHVDDEMRVVRETDITCSEAALLPSPDGLLALLEQGAPIWTGTMFRTSMVSAIGGLDPATGMVSDVDILYRLAAAYPILVDPRPGAVFSRGPNSISGQMLLQSTWPVWLRMMENLARQASLAPSVKERVEQILTHQLVTRLYGLGLASGRLGNFDDARQSADLLAARYGERSKAGLVRLFAFLFRYIPFLRHTLPRVGRRRFDYVRSDERGTPMKLDAFLTRLQTP